MEKIKILCTDAKEDNLELFRKLLQSEYEVLTALNGEEALSISRKVKGIAVVVADQRLPGMTGVDLLSRIHELDKDTICIIGTDYLDLTEVIEAVNRGHIYKYFTKPVSTDDIRRSVQQARDHYELTMEKRKLSATLEEKNRLLEKKNRELNEANITLQGIIKHYQQFQEELETNICNNIRMVLTPSLERLKNTCCEEVQKDCIISMEESVSSITSSLPRRLSRGRFPLTPTELRIADCIIHGRSTKEITCSLNLSCRTVETHRYNIRKKLGIQNKKVNLRSYLLSLR